MKKVLVVTTRWEYYVSNALGLLTVIGLIIWFGYLSVEDGGVNVKSVFFWLAIVLVIIIPFALISILSSMKSVDVMQRSIVIYYMFRKHKNVIEFSQIADITFSGKGPGSKNTLKDSFTLRLTDNRIFEFSRSQFNNYDKFKTLCRNGVASR